MTKLKSKSLNRREKLMRCWHLATSYHANDVQNHDLALLSHHCWSHINLFNLEFQHEPFVSLDVDIYEWE